MIVMMFLPDLVGDPGAVGLLPLPHALQERLAPQLVPDKGTAAQHPNTPRQRPELAGHSKRPSAKRG
jgi:hypothetical protein